MGKSVEELGKWIWICSIYVYRNKKHDDLWMWARLSVRFTHFLQVLGYSTSLRPNQCPHFTRLVLELSLRWSTSGNQLESKEGRALFLTFRHLRMATFVFFHARKKVRHACLRVDGVRAFNQLKRFIATFEVMYAGACYVCTTAVSLHVCAVDLSYFPWSVPFRLLLDGPREKCDSVFS